LIKKQNKNNNSTIYGQLAEKLACKHLIAQGYTRLENNFRCKMGEIDIIMQNTETVIFVEVRYRTVNAFGSALESITIQKQRKIIKTATFYLQKKGWLDSVSCRFDVIWVASNELGQLDEHATIHWIQDAFQP